MGWFDCFEAKTVTELVTGKSRVELRRLEAKKQLETSLTKVTAFGMLKDRAFKVSADEESLIY
jgi:hypothetical protein